MEMAAPPCPLPVVPVALRPPVDEAERKLNTRNALKDIFQDYDRDGDGRIDLNELQLMLMRVPERAGLPMHVAAAAVAAAAVAAGDGSSGLGASKKESSISGKFTEADAKRILSAFDEDGNGTVEESEFTGWVMQGLGKSPEDRSQFARSTPMAAKLESFLSALEVVVCNWSLHHNLPVYVSAASAAAAGTEAASTAGAAVRQHSSPLHPRRSASAPRLTGLVRASPRSLSSSSSPYSSEHHSYSRKHSGVGGPSPVKRVLSFHQPIFNPRAANKSSASTVSSHIYFDFRTLDFGRCVLRVGVRKQLALINDTDFDLSVLLSVSRGSGGGGFHVLRPSEQAAMKGSSLPAARVPATTMSPTSDLRFELAAHSQLIVPVKFRPLSLGVYRSSVVAKVAMATRGRATFQAVCSLHGVGV